MTVHDASITRLHVLKNESRNKKVERQISTEVVYINYLKYLQCSDTNEKRIQIWPLRGMQLTC